MEDWKLVQENSDHENSQWGEDADESIHRNSIPWGPPILTTSKPFINFDWEGSNIEDNHLLEVSHTLFEKKCATEDVIKVWDTISNFIVKKLKRGFAVKMAGLGTFTYGIRKVSVGNKHFTVKRFPIFILSEFVVKMYKLTQENGLICNVPTVPMNISYVADRLKIPRAIVEGIVTEVLQAFARGVVCNKNIEFPFPSIGKLQIHLQLVQMKFYWKFCKKLKLSCDVMIPDTILPGRMTPLSHHIPSEHYRSVFHLREVRSIHQMPLLAPVEYYLERHSTKTAIGTSAPADSEEDVLNEAAGTDEYTGDRYIYYPEPLYQPKETDHAIINSMMRNPRILSEQLAKHVLISSLEVLGSTTVKNHFHRRGNKFIDGSLSY